ncbi:preprotein translocase subunit YajC [Weissella uvarum]|uniref:preprotein translocase subunit YajC n=1 Tax=Weissella uvarum TaxID=1479233 RepID=UPI00195F262B|nr:preprotein translocase subunit YajC [Weissella uvarum]MBM7618138.1 preprotein translocase subunit YajC [Weissella uvarum]MCM0595120.1 preprotein translocase subunit YajC [Weissella uvarum]
MNSSMLIILLIIVLMYFMMIRPQQKAQKKQKEMLSNIQPGTEIVTIGGLHATVVSVSADHKTVSLDADGSFLTYDMAAIRSVVSTKDAVNEKVEALKGVQEEAEDTAENMAEDVSEAKADAQASIENATKDIQNDTESELADDKNREANQVDSTNTPSEK